MRSALQADLRDSIRARDALRTSVLRLLISVIDNAEAVPLPTEAPRNGPRARAVSEHVAVTGDGPAEVMRRELTPEQVSAVIVGEVDAMLSAAADLRARGAGDAADELERKAEVAKQYVR